MEKFTHGIMVVKPSEANEFGVPVVHFVGYWNEPTIVDVDSLVDELSTDVKFGLIEDQLNGLLEYYPATEEILNYYNEEVKKHENGK